MFSFLGCGSTEKLSTVKEVNIEKYQGTWYEIARLPNSFEKGLKCVTANYSLMNSGKIRVVNKGFSAKKNSYKTAKGVAWVPDSEFPGQLKVRFFWPFAGNYYIIALDKDYSYALVGDPSRKYLWVLSRTKTMDQPLYEELLNTAKAKGFPVNLVIKVKQDCQ
jgi:lipocalin